MNKSVFEIVGELLKQNSESREENLYGQAGAQINR